MDNAQKFDIRPGLWGSWVALPDADRTHIREVLEALSDQPPERWPTAHLKRLSTPEPRYLLEAPGDLRVVVGRSPDGRLTILDIYLQEMLDRYGAPKSEPASVE